MKNFSITLENLDDTCDEDVSLHELVQSSNDNSDSSAEIVRDIEEDKRLIDVTDGLIDIHSVVENSEGLTPEITSLVSIASNMSVAGTDVSGNQLIPATESFVSKEALQMVLEKRIKAAQESLGTSHLSIWEKIKTSLANFFNFFSKVRNKLKEIKATVKNIEKNKPNHVFTSTFRDSNGFFQETNVGGVKDFDQYSGLLKKSYSFFETYTESVSSSILIFDQLNPSITENLNKEKFEKRIVNNFNDYIKTFFTDFSKITGTQVDHTTSLAIHKNYAPIAGYCYQIKTPEKHSEVTSVDEVMDVLQKYQMVGFIRDKGSINVSEDITFENVTYKQIEKYIEALEEICNLCLRFFNNSRLWNKVYSALGDGETGHENSDSNGVVLANAIFKATNKGFKINAKQAETVTTLALTLSNVCERILISNFDLIDRLSKEKNWKEA